MSKDKCKRCGLCCHYYIKNKKYPCRYLVKLKDGTTTCSNYKNRLGTILYSYIKGNKRISIVCDMRENQDVNYPGCPYNKDNNITVEEQFKITR